MSSWFPVLQPSAVKFTSNEVASKLKNGRIIQELLNDLLEGRKLLKDIPLLEVIRSSKKGENLEWFTLDNSLLWVLQQLESSGKIAYIKMRRMELAKALADIPVDLYNDAVVVDREVKEQELKLLKVGKKRKDVRLLSTKFRRLRLRDIKGDHGCLMRTTQGRRIVEAHEKMNSLEEGNFKGIGICKEELEETIEESYWEEENKARKDLDEVDSKDTEVLEEKSLECITETAPEVAIKTSANVGIILLKEVEISHEKPPYRNERKNVVLESTCVKEVELCKGKSLEGNTDSTPEDANKKCEALEEMPLKNEKGEEESMEYIEPISLVGPRQVCEQSGSLSSVNHDIYPDESQKAEFGRSVAALTGTVHWLGSNEEFADKKSNKEESGHTSVNFSPVSSALPEQHVGKENFEKIVKDESVDGEEKSVEETDHGSIRRTRSPSVCSSVSEYRGVEDWGRREKKTKVELDDCNILSSDDDWIEIESIQDIDEEVPPQANECNDKSNNVPSGVTDDKDEKKDPILEWLQDRRKLSSRYSDNAKFLEYVAKNVDTSQQKPRRLSDSLVSLDSAFSSRSAVSLSSITKDQRQISEPSGLYGYGNFDKYNREYLGKLRAERRAAKQRLKPYDVSHSRNSRVSSRISDEEEDWDSSMLTESTKSVVYTEEIVTRRTHSETVHYSSSIDVRERRVKDFIRSKSGGYWYCHDTDRSRDNRGSSNRVEKRNWSTNRRCSSVSETLFPRRRTKSEQGSRSTLTTGSRSLSGNVPMGLALRSNALSKENLYSIWQKRREEYLEARYRSSSMELVPYRSKQSSLLAGYTCGLCFKSFKTRTRREQHSEELMHWACVTCGRFFASHTALGQHVEEVGHRKD